jgi:hypothetical protein
MHKNNTFWTPTMMSLFCGGATREFEKVKEGLEALT